MRKGIVDARALACYIKNHYKEKISDKEISPIKLQKALYFCFACWGGFTRKRGHYEEYLFRNEIEAWVYGPVVPDVVKCPNLADYFVPVLFKDNFVKEFVDNVLDDILTLSDFKLIEASYQDKSWKKNFKPNAKCIIPLRKIITEYAKRY